MKKIILKNCTVVTMKSPKYEVLENVDILIKKDTIYDIGIGIREEGAEKINMRGKVIIPGLINCHTHIPMSVFRETLEGYTLQDWLEKKIWIAESKLTKEDIYNASLLSCIEMIKSGVTTFNDMYFNTMPICAAVTKSKMRCVSTHHLMDVDGGGEEDIQEFLKVYEKYKKNKNISFALGLHGFYTSTPKYVKHISKVNKKLELPLHTHFCENNSEVETIKEVYGESPIEVLKKNFPDGRKILAHCVALSKKEIKELAGVEGVNVVYNPISNMRLGCGFADIIEMKKQNINVALGTDGQGSGSTLSLFPTMKMTALLNKGIAKNPNILPAIEVLKMATINGAKALGMEDKIGSIEIGKKADLVALDMNNIFVKPTNDIISQIVYNASEQNVYMTIVDGEVLYVKNKYIIIKDEKEVINKAEEIIKRITPSK